MKGRWLLRSSFFVIGIAALTFWLFPEQKEPVKEEITVNELPVLSVIKTDGNSISLRNIEGKAVLIFFNPDCEHCQNEAKLISEHKNMFADYTLYFISIDSIPKIEHFAQEYNLIADNFVFAQADNYQVYVAVGALRSVPAILIYNKKKLVKRTEGQIELEELKKYL